MSQLTPIAVQNDHECSNFRCPIHAKAIRTLERMSMQGTRIETGGMNGTWVEWVVRG